MSITYQECTHHGEGITCRDNIENKDQRWKKMTESVCRMLSHGEFLMQKIKNCGRTVGEKRVVEDYTL